MVDGEGLPTQTKTTTPVITSDVVESSKNQEQGSFIQRVKDKISTTYSNVKENAKKQITFANGKQIVVNTAKNVAHNLEEDVGYLGHQTVSSARNIGLTEKQSIAKYGETQYPSLFGGTGGFGDIVFSDVGNSKSKIKRVDYFSNMENDITIKTSRQKEIEHKKKVGTKKQTIEDMDILARKVQSHIKKKETAKKKKQSDINKQKKHKQSLSSIGIVRSPFENNKSKPLRRTKPKKRSNIFDEINGMFK
jgi:hypothetical protein